MPSSRKINPLSLLVLLLLVPTLSAWGQAPGNLLANGDFEIADAEGGPADWSVRDWGERSPATLKLVAGGTVGPRCLQLKGASRPLLFGCFARPVTVGPEPPAEVLLSLSYRTVASPEADVSLMTFSENFAVAEWRTPVLTSEHLPLTESKVWKQVVWRCPLLPGVQQLTVVLRILGAGELYVDGVSLRGLPSEVDCTILTAGQVSDLRGSRELRAKLVNHTATPLPVNVSLEAAAPKSPRVTGNLRVTVPAAGEELISLPYRYAPDLAHELVLTVTGPRPDVLYDQEVVAVPGLIAARLLAPLFRSMLSRTLPMTQVQVAGQLNAPPELARQLTLRGQLLGVSAVEVNAAPDDRGAFRLALPTDATLSGNYAVKLEAMRDRQPVARLELPLSKREGKGPEVIYDEQLRLRREGQPFFPLGMFYATESQDCREVAAAGFNTLVLPSRLTSLKRLDEAAALGLGVIVSSANQEAAFWSNMCAKYSNRPELLGWYPLQRPDDHLPATPPALMSDLYNSLRGLDPVHPVCLALSSLSRMAIYTPYCDVIMPWTDPKPVGDLRAVDTVLRQAQRLADGRKPVWPVLQISGAAYTQDARLDPQGAGRPPTPEEFRCMAYLAVARGAQGLFCYALTSPGARNQRPYDVRRDAPELWAMVRTVGQQLKALLPALTGGTPEPLKCTCSAVALRAVRYEGYVYVFAANPTGEPQTVFFSLPDCPTAELSLGFESGTVQGTGSGAFGDELGPRSARIYVAKVP